MRSELLGEWDGDGNLTAWERVVLPRNSIRINNMGYYWIITHISFLMGSAVAD